LSASRAALRRRTASHAYSTTGVTPAEAKNAAPAQPLLNASAIVAVMYSHAMMTMCMRQCYAATGSAAVAGRTAPAE